MFGSGILNWNFNGSFTESFQMNNITTCFVDVYFVLSEHFKDLRVSVKFDWGILQLDLFQLGLEDSNSGAELALKSLIFFFDFSSSKSNLNALSDFWSFQVQNETFQSSINLFSSNSFGIVHLFELSEELNQLGFVFLVFWKLLVDGWSTSGSLWSEAFCSNFQATDIWKLKSSFLKSFF